MAQIDLPFGFNRLFKGSAILDQVFTSTVDLNAYLTNPVRYAGMIVSLVEAGEVVNYSLNATEDEWVELGGGGSSSTGLIGDGASGIISGIGTALVSVTDGNGIVVDAHTDPSAPDVSKVEWVGLTNVALDDISASFTSLAIDRLGALIQRPDDIFTIEDRRDYIYLGTIIHIGGTIIESISQKQQLAFGGLHHVQDMGSAIGTINVSGNTYMAAAADLTIKKTAGCVFEQGSNYSNSLKSPNYFDQPEVNPVTFIYNYMDGVGDWTPITGQTNIDPSIWDDGSGTPSTVNNSNWSIQRIFHSSTSDLTVIQLGQVEYANLSQAVGGLLTEPFIKNPALSGLILRGYIVVKGNCSDLSDTSQAYFVETDKFGNNPAGGVGGVTLEQDEFYIRQLQTFRNESPVGWFTDSANVTTSEEIINTIDGSRSALMSQTTALVTDKTSSHPAHFTDEIMKKRRVTMAFEFVTSINSGKFRVDTVVTNGTGDRVVNSQELKETDYGTFRSEFYVASDDIEAYFDIVTEEPDDLNTIVTDNFRLDLAPAQVKNFTVEQTYKISQAGNALTNGSDEIQYNLDTATIVNEDHELIIVEDDTPNTRTKFRATRDLTIKNVSFQTETVLANRAATVWLNDAIVAQGTQPTTATAIAAMSAGFSMKAGDYFTVGLASDTSRGSAGNIVRTNFVATAQSSGTVFATDINNDDYSWNSYTPVFQGFGTPTSVNIEWRRVGGDMEIRGSFDPASVSADEAQLGLPNGHTIATGEPIRVVGYWNPDATTVRSGGTMLATGGDSYLNFSNDDIFGATSAQNALTPVGGDAGGNSGSPKHFNVSVKIQGWENNNLVQHLIVENFGNVVAASTLGTGELENNFKAEINNNGTASIEDQNLPFIQSVNRSALGTVTVTFVPNFFSSPPLISVKSLVDAKNVYVGSAVTVSGFSTTGRGNTDNSDQDIPFTISATRDSVDYKSKANYINNLLIENYDGSFETTTQILGANNPSAADVFTLTLDADADYIILGSMNLESVSAQNNQVRLRSGAGDTGTIFDTASLNKGTVGSLFAHGKIATLVKASEHNGALYVYHNALGNLFGNGTRDQTWIQAIKQPKKLGVDQLGQVVTNHVTGGTEYELKGQLWNGKQIYARSYSYGGSASDITIDTIDINLTVIEMSGSFDIGADIRPLPYTTSAGQEISFQYIPATGVLKERHVGITSQGSVMTIKYLKP